MVTYAMNQDITKSLGGHFGLRSHSQAFSIRGIMTGKNHCGMARGKGISGRVRLVYFLSNCVVPCCCCSVSKSCLTLCNPMNSSPPGFPVLHPLLEFVQTHVYWVGGAIHPSHPLSPPSPPVLSSNSIRVIIPIQKKNGCSNKVKWPVTIMKSIMLPCWLQSQDVSNSTVLLLP